jgi:hypothetical protein
MPQNKPELMLLLTSEEELSSRLHVWGTGGWLPPEQREALDWLTLSRLMGWGVTVTRWTHSGLDTGSPDGSRLIVLACDPNYLGEDFVAQLTARLASEPLLVVARAGASNGTFARLAGAACRPERITGRSLHWLGPGAECNWDCCKELDASALELSEDTAVWATLDGAPVIAARQVGRGVVATLGFHPSEARDIDGAATALLKHLLIWGSAGPVAWLDFEGSLILRMDDPGGAQNIYSRNWSYPKLGEVQWTAIGADLKKRNARLSIGYVSGWVDDGDAARGKLEVTGVSPVRIPGRIHPSPAVKYQDLTDHAPGVLHDYESEYRGIQALRTAGLGDIELHGYTHMHPDSVAWARASDRDETWPATSWYRELGRAAEESIAARSPEEHPLALGLAAFRHYFGVHPTTLICPGDQWTNTVLERALDLGLQLVSSYYLALRDGDRFCWAQHVCAPYLDTPDPVWFAAGLPVVGYFHDRELALEGVGWMSHCFDQWQDAGARRFMDFRELAAALSRRLSLQEYHGVLHLTVTNASALPLVRPLTVGIRVPHGRLPSYVSVALNDRGLSLPVDQCSRECGFVSIPCAGR